MRWNRRPWPRPSPASPPASSASRPSAAWSGVQNVLFGTGPTTGLVIDPQGYIVSSAFNFVNKPASILVRLPDGTPKLGQAGGHRSQPHDRAVEDRGRPAAARAGDRPRGRDARGAMVHRRGADLPAPIGPTCRVGILSAAGTRLGQGPADRRRPVAEQLRRPAGRYPRPRHGRDRAPLAAVGRRDRRRRVVRFGHRLRRAGRVHPQDPASPAAKGPRPLPGTGRLHPEVARPVRRRHDHRRLPRPIRRPPRPGSAPATGSWRSPAEKSPAWPS